MRPLLFLLLVLLTAGPADAQTRRRLPEPLNLREHVEYAPSLTADGRTLIFQSDRYGLFHNARKEVPVINSEGNQMKTARETEVQFFGVYETRLQPGGQWSRPEPIEAINRFDRGMTPVIGGPSISYDGNTLFFFAHYPERTVGFGREDLYYCLRERGGWSAPINLGPNLNTPGYEGFPSISPDGRHLYFIRENLSRKAEGETRCYRIMRSERGADGRWKRPIELPAPVNLDCEKAPRIMADGRTLVFSSLKKDGKGDFDLYLSRFQDDGTWSPPLPLDVINTRRSDQSVAFNACGDVLYYVSDGDIYTTEIPEALRPFKRATVQGFVTDSLTGAPLQVRVVVNDAATGQLLTTAETSPADGRFTVLVPPTTAYRLRVDEPAYRQRTLRVEVEDFRECRVIPRDFRLVSVNAPVSTRRADIAVLTEPAPTTERATAAAPVFPEKTTQTVVDSALASARTAAPTTERLAAAEAAPNAASRQEEGGTPAEIAPPPTTERLAAGEAAPQETSRPTVAPHRPAEVVVAPTLGKPTVEKVVAEQEAERRNDLRTVADATPPPAPPAVATAPPKPETYEIVVLVRHADTEAGIQGARLSLTAENPPRLGTPDFDDVRNAYRLRVPTGTTLTLRAEAPGFLPAEARLAGVSQDQRVLLKLPEQKPSVLRISVLDFKTGAPLPSAFVDVAPEGGKPETLTWTGTVLETTFTTPGPVSLTARAPGYTTVQRQLRVEVVPEGKFYEFEARLDRITFSLSAQAVDRETGQKIPQARFRVVNLTQNAPVSLTENPAQGSAEAVLPGTGEFEVTCEAPGYTAHTERVRFDKEQNQLFFKLSPVRKAVRSVVVSVTDAFTGEALAPQARVSGAKLAAPAPLRLAVTEGDVPELALTAPGYPPLTRRLTEAEIAAGQVELTMQKSSYEFSFRAVSEADRQPVRHARFVVLVADTKEKVPLDGGEGEAVALLSPLKKYSVNALADGFNPAQTPFNPAEALYDHRTRRDLLLRPVAAAPKPTPPPAETPKVVETKTFGTIERGKAVTLRNIFFDQSSPVLRQESFAELDRLVEVLVQNPTLRIELRGHTDNAGDFDANVKLSRDRCQSVIAYLVQRGVDRQRLQFVGRGPVDPVAPNTTEENRRKNRRVEFVVL